MPTRRTALGLRLLFAAVALSLPAMLLVREHGTEPYPALYQPEFGSVPPTGPLLDRRLLELRVTDAGGVRHTLDPLVLVRARGVDRVTLRREVASAFRSSARARTPQARRWLVGRLTELGVAEPVTLRVVWRRARLVPGRRDAAEPGPVVRSYGIDLRGPA